jgi:hypothetical protein
MAAKYKVQTRGGMHVVLTVSSTDLNTVLGVRDFVPRGLQAVAEGGAVNLIEVSKDRKVFIGLAHDDILKSDGASWGSTVTETVTNLNAFFLTSPHDLQDLEDVPVPVATKYLRFVDGAFSWVDASGSGTSELASSLAVTNTLGDAIADTTTYSAGTALESIIRDIIAPFLEPTIISVVPSFSVPITGRSLVESGVTVFPTGETPSITGYTVSTTNFGNLSNGLSIQQITSLPNQEIFDNSSLSITSNTTAVSSFTYTVPTITQHGFQLTVQTTMRHLADGTGSSVAVLNTSKLEFRDTFFAVGSSVSTPTSVAQLLGSDGTLVNNSLAIKNISLQTYAFDCSPATLNSSNFTYLIISSIFAIDEIAASVSGRGIADYTDSFTLLGSNYSYTVGSHNRTYKIYRSNQTGAFDSDVTLNLTISKP